MSQSDQLVLVSSDSEGGREGCRGKPSETTLDKISYFAMGFVIVGLIFAAIGFLYPRDIQRDPDASARENEDVDQEYMALTKALNAIIITGMILIGLGGLILSAIFTNSVVCRECDAARSRRNDDAERRALSSSQPMTSQPTRPRGTESADTGHNYGTVSAEHSY
ncbi:uncharacterized protein [Littorina saxatilis]|uniref:uncharacterized protein n=1 Tax=Littorina saxatilis TaxID=31220 RepID=UPI0038B4883B